MTQYQVKHNYIERIQLAIQVAILLETILSGLILLQDYTACIHHV